VKVVNRLENLHQQCFLALIPSEDYMWLFPACFNIKLASKDYHKEMLKTLSILEFSSHAVIHNGDFNFAIISQRTIAN